VAKARLKVVSIPDAGKECIEFRLRDLSNRSTLLAIEVIVRVVGEVIDRLSVTQVDVDDHTSALERIQGSIHGSQMDGGVLGLHGVGDLLGGQMTPRLYEGGYDVTTWAGDAMSRSRELG
jgi:hypothetical protein